MIHRLVNASILGIGLVFIAILFIKSADNGATRYTQVERALRTINQRNSNVDSAVLSLRLGLDQDYDSLTHGERELERSNPLSCEQESNAGWRHSLEQHLKPLIARKVLLVTDFKANHSVVKNSVAGFSYHIRKAIELNSKERNGSLAKMLANLDVLGARFVVSGNIEDQARFEVSMELVKKTLLEQPASSSFQKSVALTLRHALKLIERRIELDHTIAQLVAVPIQQTTLQLMDEEVVHYQTQSKLAGWYRRGLSTAILMLVAFLLLQFFALLKHKVAIAFANATLEQRVVDRTEELHATNLELESTIADVEKLALVAQYTDNAVVITDAQTKIEWVNDGFTRMTGYQSEEVIGKRPSELFHGPKTDPAALEVMRTAVRAKKGFDVETINYRKNGEPFWMAIEAKPIRDSQGNINRFIAIESDISERIEAEAERQKLNEQLVVASRTAGMADIATSVLHNVGNTLNSVNISASMIRSQFENSAVAYLEKLSDLLSEHENDFPVFVQEDERGQKIPDFIVKVTDELSHERAQIQGELNDLLSNVEHIKKIISSQQALATTSGLQQEIPLAALVNDAIITSKGILSDYPIEILLEIEEDLPRLISDKHKILQIFVNLIKNAKDALLEQQTVNPQIKIRVTCCEENVLFEVIDNGMGISPEMLDKIFQHGFTTKPTGHGFGLHGSANAATQLGGSLSASSPGIGKGAAFQLKLPLARQTSATGCRQSMTLEV